MKNNKHIKPKYYFVVFIVNLVIDFIGFWVNYVGISFVVSSSTRGGFIGGDGSLTSVLFGLSAIFATCVCSFSVNKKIYKKYVNENWNVEDLFFLIPLMIFAVVALIYPANLSL